MSKLVLGIGILIAGCGGLARGDELPDAAAILNAAIKAHGGETALAKPVGIYCNLKGIGYDSGMKSPISFEMHCTKDKQRVVMIDEVEIFNGTEGWTKEGREPTERMNDAQIRAAQESIYQNWATLFVLLKGKEFQLSVLPEIEVAGRKTDGLLVRHDKHDPLKLYFDNKTHLLAKMQFKFKDPDTGKDYDQEDVFSDFRDVQKTKQPFKFSIYWDGNKISDFELKEMKLYEKPLDEKLFVKP